MNIICIGCPMGCELNIVQTNDAVTVSGWECKIGETYGREEAYNPTRNIATSVKIEGGDMPLVSVKMSKPIPKPLIMQCVNEIKRQTLYAPIKIGDIILPNVAGTGIDAVATRDVKKTGAS